METKQQAITTASSAVLEALQDGIVESRHIIGVVGGSFTEDYVKTGPNKGQPYLKGTMLGHDGTKFSTGKVVNLYFVNNDAGAQHMEFLQETSSGTIYFVSGAIGLIENDLSDSVSVQVSNTEICLFDEEGLFQVDETLFEGKAGTMVTQVIKYTNTFNIAALDAARGNYRTKSISLKETDKLRQEALMRDLGEAYSVPAVPVMEAVEEEELSLAGM